MERMTAFDHVTHGLARFYPLRPVTDRLEALLEKAVEKSPRFARLIDAGKQGHRVARLLTDVATAVGAMYAAGALTTTYQLEPHILSVPALAYGLTTLAYTLERAGVTGKDVQPSREELLVGGVYTTFFLAVENMLYRLGTSGF